MSKLHFDDTIGAAFVGFSVAAVLYGVLSIQIHTYFQRYTLDRPVYKFFVAAVWILETLHSVLTGHVVYYYAISNFDNPLALLVPTWTLIAQVLVGAVISVLVKSAFAIRVWRFSGNNIVLTGLIAILNCGILGLAVLFTIKASRLSTFAELPSLKWVTTAVLGTSVLVDLIIAVSLTFFLYHLRRAFTASSLVNGLIMYSIETGAITSVCGIATLITFDAMPTTFVYMTFFFVLSKLYSNSLLATLNTRRAVRGRGTDRSQGLHGDFTIVLANGQQATHSSFGQVDGQKQTQDLELNILKEVWFLSFLSLFLGLDMLSISLGESSRSSTAPDSSRYDQSYPQQNIPILHYVNATEGLRSPERVARS
ncbi:hypothetical protein DFH11DRAFT_1731689 [Phellopilus nigrolimitatus]|nr:hypothetical protein DFH11DRAFT_1731689 [Phellopilus nigrolimitatus]